MYIADERVSPRQRVSVLRVIISQVLTLSALVIEFVKFHPEVGRNNLAPSDYPFRIDVIEVILGM